MRLGYYIIEEHLDKINSDDAHVDNHRKLHFYVSDTGIGISPDKQHLVFDRFVRLDNFVNGTDLGLYISKHIINSMGGTIGVKSELGKDSTFWFEIPVEIIS